MKHVFVVESNIPTPTRYPFAQMKVGDSFAIPDEIKSGSIKVNASRYGKQNNMKFTIRRTADGYRCWRVA